MQSNEFTGCCLILSELMEKTQEYLEVPEFDLTKSIVSDQDQIIWESIGLTSDVQAIENAAVITKVHLHLFLASIFI